MFFLDLNSSGVVPVMNSKPFWDDVLLSLDCGLVDGPRTGPDLVSASLRSPHNPTLMRTENILQEMHIPLLTCNGAIGAHEDLESEAVEVDER
jgi:hypothetical protein